MTKTGKLNATVADRSERMDLSFIRNASQALAGAVLALVGAVVGFFLAKDAPVLGAIGGFILGGIAGVFLVGLVLCFLPKPPIQRTPEQIATRYRTARKRFLIHAALLPLMLLAAFPLMQWQNAWAWTAWGAVAVFLFFNGSSLAQQIREWTCPCCSNAYGYPGLVRDLLAKQYYRCQCCEFSMFEPNAVGDVKVLKPAAAKNSPGGQS